MQTIQTTMLRKSIIQHESGFHVITLLIPLRVFMWDTAIRRMVSLSGLRASVLQVGTMSHNSLMYEVILFLLLLSISQWLSLCKKKRKIHRSISFSSKKHNKEGINELVLTSSILNYVCQFFKIANRCQTQVRFSSVSQARIGGKW